jgi:hypothetical protein
VIVLRSEKRPRFGKLQCERPYLHVQGPVGRYMGEGVEQEPIAAYRPRDHQAKGSMCPSDVQHSKASDLVQEELMTLHGVVRPRINIVLIVRVKLVADSYCKLFWI